MSLIFIWGGSKNNGFWGIPWPTLCWSERPEFEFGALNRSDLTLLLVHVRTLNSWGIYTFTLQKLLNYYKLTLISTGSVLQHVFILFEGDSFPAPVCCLDPVSSWDEAEIWILYADTPHPAAGVKESESTIRRYSEWVVSQPRSILLTPSEIGNNADYYTWFWGLNTEKLARVGFKPKTSGLTCRRSNIFVRGCQSEAIQPSVSLVDYIEITLTHTYSWLKVKIWLLLVNSTSRASCYLCCLPTARTSYPNMVDTHDK